MLDLNLLRTQTQRVAAIAKSRGCTVDLPLLLVMDRELQTQQRALETAQAERNAATKTMAGLSPGERDAKRASLRSLGDRVDTLIAATRDLEQRLNEQVFSVPNIVADDVLIDPDPTHNQVIREVGTRPTFAFAPRDYLTIAETLDCIDIPRAAKVSGSRFGYLKGIAAQLEFALLQFAFQRLTAHGFTPVVPPVLVRADVLRGVGYLEAGGTLERYRLEKDGLYLLGSAEQSLVPMHMDETFAADALPRRYAGFSTAFRREAGAYGRDTRGIFRVHQFDKLELVSFARPDQGDAEHVQLLAIEEELLQALGLPYRVLRLVSGDTAFPLARTYDIECWLPSERRYRETHSCSTALDFQARRLNIRYRSGRDTGFVHTLNATGLAIGRTLIAIIEHYQTERGFRIPDVLAPLVGTNEVTAP